MSAERRYNSFTLDELEAHAANNVLRSPTTLALIARIRELETESGELARMDVEIRAWEEADHDNPLARTWEISGHDGMVWWHWDNGAIGGHGNRGQTETIIDAIRALYQSLVEAGEITP